MKQHISIKQLNELSEKGRKKLRKWWKPQVGDCFVILYDNTTPRSIGNTIYVCTKTDIMRGGVASTPSFLPLLSIGKTIEFLGDKYVITNRNASWRVWDRNGKHRMIENKILCDALWEACKEVLENE